MTSEELRERVEAHIADRTKSGKTPSRSEMAWMRSWPEMFASGDPHPWYGPCDGMGNKDGECSECEMLAKVPRDPAQGASDGEACHQAQSENEGSSGLLGVRREDCQGGGADACVSQRQAEAVAPRALRSALEGLVEKWRAQAHDYKSDPEYGPMAKADGATLEDCADELSALLAALPRGEE